MKYLSDYVETAQIEMFEKYGAFFAFTNKQFDEQKKEGIKYTQIQSGLICPKENAGILVEQLNKINKMGMEEDIAENGKSAIIQRELSNHEAQITMDITDTLYDLEGYGFSEEDVQKEYEIFFAECVKNDWF